MSTIAAASDEQATFDGVSDDGLGMMIPISQPVQAIKTEFVQPANDPEENLTPGYVELTNTTHNSLSIVANDYQFLTDAPPEHETLTNATDDVSQSTDSSDNLLHSTSRTSSDFQLLIPADDHQEPANDDQQRLTNDTDVEQQPSNDSADTCEQLTSNDGADGADVCEQPTTEPTNNSSDQLTPVENHKQPENQQINAEQQKADVASPRPLHIPPHLMGRDLNNPAQDLVGTNRRVQKPRLGVKVPYRNLTSQIVTQDEIAQEILERQMRKYSYTDVPEGGDVLFAYKLTHRLANKITSNENLDKKNLEAAKTVATTVANVTASDSSPKTDAQVSADTSTPSAGEVSNTDIQAETSNTDTHAETSNTNVRVEPSNTDVSSTITGDTATVTPTTSAPAEPAVTTTNNVQPAPTETPQLDLKSDSSPVDELYAEISSTLKEEYDPTATPVQLFSAAQLKAHQSSAKLTTSSTVNGSMTIHGETELDNDTLLAILEGTTDVNEPCTAPGGTPPPPPQTAIISTPTLEANDKKRRKKRMKPILDPLLEKELALKQLMAFETKRKERKPKSVADPKPKVVTLPTLQNGVVAASKPNLVPVTPAAASTPKVPKVPPTDSPKKTKRAPNSYNVSSQAPKRFPKKYQRIIKQQLRSSKKMKTKNQSPDQQPQPQKKLPEVPEVQIAIDRYIKTYASKRKHKPDCHSSEKLVVKKMKTDTAVSNVTPAAASTKVALASGNSPATSTKAVVAKEKAVVAVKPTSVSEKPVAASAKIVPAGKATAACETVAAVIKAVVAASAVPTQSPQPPIESMDVDELPATSTENEVPVDAEATPEVAEKEQEEAMAKSKMNMKMMREINRLLGDEGAINMIYSVEQKRQPANKRDANAVLPSARRKKKDLQLRTKLVKDAVLRLSMSGSSQGTPTRTVRRTSPETTPETPVPAKGASTSAVAALRKASIESVESTSSEMNNNNNNSSSCVSTPRVAKTRQLAAEASRIIRRHSSSSAYSSDEEEETPRKGSGDKSESTTTSLQSESIKTTTPGAAVAGDKVDACGNECVPKSTSVKTAVAEKKGAGKSSEHLKTKSPAGSRRASKEPPVNAESEVSRVQPDAAVNGSLGSGMSITR